MRRPPEGEGWRHKYHEISYLEDLLPGPKHCCYYISAIRDVQMKRKRKMLKLKIYEAPSSNRKMQRPELG